MAKGSDLDRVTSIVLRQMRPPILALLGVNTVGVAVMVMIPGVDGTPMGIFHAIYFMSFTASTTGFGELPTEFSDPQRLWAIVCIYMSVIAWIYAIGTIINKVQNPHFVLAIAQARFARAAARINEPFVIICGFGDTGSLLARGLSDHHMTGVVIDSDSERIKALSLRDYEVAMPGLEGDASVPKNLQDAGISRPNCRGVVLLTGNEDVNLKIAVMTRLLNPDAEVICRSTERTREEELTGLGSVILADPFETFARELGFALHQPPLHTLDKWFAGARDVTLDRLVSYNRGTWILVGYGRMGRWLYRSLREWGVHVVVVDPQVDESGEVEHCVVGLGTRANLIEAGAEDAAGVVIATDSDADNLAVLLSSRALNPAAHLIVRQNSHENELAFNAASADLIMQPSLVTARRILLRLISPLIQELLEHLEKNPRYLIDVVYPQLQQRVGSRDPALWTVRIDSSHARAVVDFLATGSTLTSADLYRDSRDRDQPLACVPLMLRRGAERVTMPADNYEVIEGDEILMCSTAEAKQRVTSNLTDIYTIEYLATGIIPPRAYAMRRLQTATR
ncbi:MAG: NAD-binding protein [Gammaproteobacteria bacterium]|nr:NAD-binding protein [Gammaproteobacteria bacterium]